MFLEYTFDDILTTHVILQKVKSALAGPVDVDVAFLAYMYASTGTFLYIPNKINHNLRCS